MYTNRGFLQRNYQRPTVKPSNDFYQPKFQNFIPSPSKYTSALKLSSSVKQIFKDYSNTPYHEKPIPKIYSLSPKPSNYSENFSNSTTREYQNKSSLNYPNQIIIQKPLTLSSSIFEIFISGYGFNHPSGFSNALGTGFLISKSIAITANSLMPDEDFAKRCFARFNDSLSEVHSFDPNSFFFTHKELNFTIVSFVVSPNNSKPRVPLDIKQDFVLRTGDSIVYMNSGSINRTISSVDSESFSYTGSSTLSTGTPIFTVDWHLQGIHHTCTASYRFSQATRIDVVIKTLKNLKSISMFPELDLLLSGYATHDNLQKIDVEDSNLRYLYWIEWYNKNIYRYDISLERWGKLTISNLASFLETQGDDWNFNWGSRILIHSQSVFIVGGIGHEISSTKSDFYEFRTDSKEIHKKKNMNERREGCAIVFCQGFLYVMGGKYNYATCERHNLKENTWENISPMNYGRYEPVATVLMNEKKIFVAGGFPQALVGKSIEKYDILDNNWEILNVTLPCPIIHSGILQVGYSKFLLIGGRYCKSVFSIEINQEEIGRSATSPYSDVVICREIDSLQENFETLLPVLHYKSENRICIMKTKEGATPQIIYYSLKDYFTQEKNVSKYF